MDSHLTLNGTGVVCRADGTRLPGERRYSFTLLPYEVPILAASAPARPACVGCFVELTGTEPLELEGEHLVIITSDNRRVRFQLIEVSDTPPHSHTTIVESWPEMIGADVHVTVQTQPRPVTA